MTTHKIGSEPSIASHGLCYPPNATTTPDHVRGKQSAAIRKGEKESVNAVYTLISLVLEGAIWAAGISCLLRGFKKITDDDFKRWIARLSPVWAGTSLVFVAAFSGEAFIAVYGASEYEGVSILQKGNPLSQASLFVQVSPSIALYLLPAILLSRKARQSISLVYLISGLCFIFIIAVPHFQSWQPMENTEPQLPKDQNRPINEP